MKKKYFGASRYDIHLDMKLDYTLSKIFQEMSSSELETFHHLCELEREHILQSVALEVLEIPYAGSLLSNNRSIFIDCEGNISCTTRVLKKFQRYTFLKIKNLFILQNSSIFC